MGNQRLSSLLKLNQIYKTEKFNKFLYSSNKLRKTQNDHRLSKFDRSAVVNLMPISYFWVFVILGFLSKNFWSELSYPLTANT